jgi:hypothetical protein
MEDGRICWYCGAPADPEYVQEVVLAASSPELLTLGYPVTRGRLEYRLRVQVPRCSACRNRMFAWAGYVIIAGVIGLAAGALIYQSASGAEMLGVVGFFSGAGAAVCRGFWLGLRRLQDFPPLGQLRAIGWRTPD